MASGEDSLRLPPQSSPIPGTRRSTPATISGSCNHMYQLHKVISSVAAPAPSFLSGADFYNFDFVQLLMNVLNFSLSRSDFKSPQPCVCCVICLYSLPESYRYFVLHSLSPVGTWPYRKVYSWLANRTQTPALLNQTTEIGLIRIRETNRADSIEVLNLVA